MRACERVNTHDFSVPRRTLSRSQQLRSSQSTTLGRCCPSTVCTARLGVSFVCASSCFMTDRIDRFAAKVDDSRGICTVTLAIAGVRKPWMFGMFHNNTTVDANFGER